MPSAMQMLGFARNNTPPTQGLPTDDSELDTALVQDEQEEVSEQSTMQLDSDQNTPQSEPAQEFAQSLGDYMSSPATPAAEPQKRRRGRPPKNPPAINPNDNPDPQQTWHTSITVSEELRRAVRFRQIKDPSANLNRLVREGLELILTDELKHVRSWKK